MKQAYGKFKKLGRNEAAVVFAITFAVVVAYSAWGAYLLHTQVSSSPQVVSVGR